MDNVILLQKHLTTIKVKSVTKSKWVKGELIPGQEITKEIKAVYLPVSSDVLKYYPQGIITIQDYELFTKEDLNQGDKITLKDQEYEIFEKVDFDYLADLKTYIIKRSTKDD